MRTASAWCSGGLVVVLAVSVACAPGGEEDEVGLTARRVDERGRVALNAVERESLDLASVGVSEGTLVSTSLRFGVVVARPEEDALVVAPVTGRLEVPRTALGASVKEGDVLGVLEPLTDAVSGANLEADRRRLIGQIETARAQVEAKKADLERMGTLVATGLATAADRAQAEASLRAEQALENSLQRAKDALSTVSSGGFTLRAPTAGTVVALATGAGSMVGQGAVLARIVRPGPRWIDVAVPPSDPVGDHYSVRAIAGEVSAQLLNRGAIVHADGTRRDRLIANEKATAVLLPGATVPVDVLHELSGVIVPIDAILREGDRHVVFVEVQDGLYALRDVRVGARDSGQAVIESGLSAGERVVVRGGASLLGELAAGPASTGGDEKG